MTKEQMRIILDNLIKEGLTQGQAYMRLRRLLVIRLTYAPAEGNVEEKLLQDIDLLDSMCVRR